MSPDNRNELDPYEDDYDDIIDDDVEEGAAPQNWRQRIRFLWDNNPGFKVGTIVVGGIILVGTAFTLLDSGQKIDTGKIAPPSNVSGAPGGVTSKEVQSITNKENEDRTKQAAETGGSAILTPEGASKQPPPAAPEKQIDPLAQWTASQPPAAAPAAITTAAPPAVQQQQQAQQQQQQQENAAVDKMSQAMSTQMQSLLGTWGPISPNVISFTQPAQANGQQNAQGNPNNGVAPNTVNNGAGLNAAGVTPAAAQLPAKVLQAAGEIKYGELITEANSDIDGTPILAEVQTGPLKKARLIGQFEVRQDFMVLRFSRLVYKKKEYPTDILALDPNTTLGGMATEVDQRYFTRVVLPAAASFVQGLGQGIAESGTTTTIVDNTVVQSQAQKTTRQAAYEGLGNAAQTVGNFLQQQGAQTKPLIRVEAGTPLGLFFVQSVTEPVPGTVPANQTPSTNQPALPLGSPVGAALGQTAVGTAVQTFAPNPNTLPVNGTAPSSATTTLTTTSPTATPAFGSTFLPAR